MIETMTQPTTTWPTAHVGPGEPRRVNETSGIYLVQPQPSLNYAGFMKILSARNASVDLGANVFLELQDIDGAVTGNWIPLDLTWGARIGVGLPKTEPTRALSLRRVSLAEARRSAIKALEEAEARRQHERECEAAFWATLEDEE